MVTIHLDTSMFSLSSYKEKVVPKIKAGLKAGALIITNEAKENRVPIVSGNLKRSIHDKPVEDDNNGYSTQIGTDVSYARKIEYGGSKKAPDGYLRVSLDDKGDEAINEIRLALKQLF